MSQPTLDGESKVLTFEKRPWGEFEVLKDEKHFKCKVLRVNPGHQISYQSHDKRTEYWTVVAGEGVVIIDGVDNPARYGSTFKIVVGQKHRLRNTGSAVLEIVEVQVGTYFGEDDIKRYEDDYKR